MSLASSITCLNKSDALLLFLLHLLGTLPVPMPYVSARRRLFVTLDTLQICVLEPTAEAGLTFWVTYETGVQLKTAMRIVTVQ